MTADVDLAAAFRSATGRDLPLDRQPWDEGAIEWRAVPGYAGAYEVSSDGQVRSLPRMVGSARGWMTKVPGRVLKATLTPGGYHRVSLSIEGGSRSRFVHHLVLEAFVGPRPQGMLGCHNNGDPLDNRIANLRWDTPSGNMADCIAHGRHPQLAKTRCPRGHVYDVENTRTRPDGSRLCRACHREAERRRGGAA